MTRTGPAQEFYSRWATPYDLLASHAPGVGRIRGAAVDALDPSPGDTVLELGCGTGANFPALREAVGPEGTVVGVDLTAGMLSRARARIDREGWANVHVVRGDATHPPVARADAVFASFLVGMLADPGEAVRTWLDHLRPGGWIALLDLARSTRPVAGALNPLFRAFVLASSPRGTRRYHGESPTRVLDRRVAAAHRKILESCNATTHETTAFGFVRVSSGRREG
ncbi:class I SAM-dependent methyltransferase [Haloplanus sp. GCM10025708]|uniref:class I SAM-dependent methyltransferase n=1 Tax=Haloferacaceae TaxID=1644056 RepID=UPI00360EBFBA